MPALRLQSHEQRSQTAPRALAHAVSCEAVGAPWWLRAGALACARGDRALSRHAYRLGNGVLELEADAPILTRTLEDHYGECAVAPSDCPDLPRVRCSVRLAEQGRLAIVHFHEPAIAAFDVALALLKHPAADPLYVEREPGADGWRLLEEASGATPVTAARGPVVLLDCGRLPVRVLAQLLINPVLAAQREFLFAHAASLGMDGAGVLIVGPSHSGKTTAALALAARGHAFFGDDVAAIRTAGPELSAFWRTAHVRPGPHARALARHVESGQWDPPYADGMPRLRMRVSELFAQAPVAAVPLRLALFLRGFAAQPQLEFFAPTPEALGRSARFALNNVLWVAWGTTPQRRLMQFLLFMRLLARIRCAWLDVGDPDATADLIEKTMEHS